MLVEQQLIYIKLGYKNIIGLDIADKLIDSAKEYIKKNNLDIEFVLGDATDLKYDDNLFDIVIFSFNGLQTIPGINNRLKVLKEAYRVLKPNGLFIFTAHDRDGNKEFSKFWEEEKLKWEKGIQDKRLEIYGDRYMIDKTGEEGFIHFSSIEEMIEFINNTDFKIVEYVKSNDIAIENEKTKEFALDTVFWILQK